MERKTERPKLMVSIVERRRGKDIIKLYDREGVTFHYQTVGRGTATSEIMDILGLESRDKDIVISLAAESLINQLVYRMSNELRGSIDTKGIFFDLPLTGMSNMIAAAFSLSVPEPKKDPAPRLTETLLEKAFPSEQQDTGKEEPAMSSENRHSLILISVNQGYTETVLDTARTFGARGGTILRARWSGVKALESYHGISLQTEKEIIVIIVPNDLRNRIMDEVNKKHGLKTNAQAIVCSMKVDHFAPI
ncbi:MAG: hypothetical protein K2N46_02020 [Lachnospiraceae bacterium]|nr:hypothetical protein [Lachnospiraceae bacterium]